MKRLTIAANCLYPQVFTRRDCHSACREIPAARKRLSPVTVLSASLPWSSLTPAVCLDTPTGLRGLSAGSCVGYVIRQAGAAAPAGKGSSLIEIDTTGRVRREQDGAGIAGSGCAVGPGADREGPPGRGIADGTGWEHAMHERRLRQQQDHDEEHGAFRDLAVVA